MSAGAKLSARAPQPRAGNELDRPSATVLPTHPDLLALEVAREELWRLERRLGG